MLSGGRLLKMFHSCFPSAAEAGGSITDGGVSSTGLCLVSSCDLLLSVVHMDTYALFEWKLESINIKFGRCWSQNGPFPRAGTYNFIMVEEFFDIHSGSPFKEN